MKKRYWFISIISVFILGAVFFSLTRKRNNHSTFYGEYMYDSLDSSCSYSEKNVFYLADSGILHLIDTDSGKDIIYCDKPNCTHERYSHNNENPSCPAVFYGLCKSGIVVHNGHLYFLGNMTDEDFCTQYLYEMDVNGENRKSVVALPGIEKIRYVLYRDNYVIGGYYNRVELNDEHQIINENKPEAGIFVIDLENYEFYKGEILTGEQINITDISYENGFVYYSIVRFNDGVTEKVIADATEGDFADFIYNNRMYDIHKYDIKNKEDVLITVIDHVYDLDLIGMDAYYTTKDGYYKFDTASGEKVSLDAVKKTVPKDEVLFYGFKSDGNDLYFSYRDESNECVYCRLKENDVIELMRLPAEKAFGFVCICGTSVYINYNDDEGKFCLGVININDLNSGVYKPMKLRYYNE